jgi:glutamine synthetase
MSQDILKRAQDAQLRLVRFLYCDNGGIIRGKAAHISQLAERLDEGIGFVVAMQAWSGAETFAQVEGMGPIGEFRLVPDPDTFAILPYVPSTASMMGDMLLLDGTPWEACPRSFLKRMVARLAEEGMRAEAAVEHEFYLIRQTFDSSQEGKPVSYCPADTSRLFSTTGLNEHARVVDAILSALEEQGVTPALFHTEYGPGQQELSVRHSGVLQAADTACLIRETVRGVTEQCGLFASFDTVGKPL